MSHKNDVSQIFSLFKSQVDNLFNSSIKILRTDGGTKFKPIFTIFPHITHQISCPYTPQQNGVAERKHRHIIEFHLPYLLNLPFLPVIGMKYLLL
jgi:hypothetical protein